MADENRDRENDTNAQGDGDQPREEQSGAGGQRDENGEWVRDQVGEDRNLSGSSTYRTLPDQPEGEQPDLDSGDVSDRQSNR